VTGYSISQGTCRCELRIGTFITPRNPADPPGAIEGRKHEHEEQIPHPFELPGWLRHEQAMTCPVVARGPAADLATTVARLVQRGSVQHGGKPIKWLGDGVMFYFRDPGPGVRAALEMVDGLAAAGLPPGHVGLHAGPVLFQEGDYFRQTVNLSARIAD
jgi:hypothetical protein